MFITEEIRPEFISAGEMVLINILLISIYAMFFVYFSGIILFVCRKCNDFLCKYKNK